MTDRRRQVLEAAMTAFGLYGFRRTSMADIARAAGLSRPALYLQFRNKEDIFRSLSEALQAQAVEAAAAGLSQDGPFAARLGAALLGRERVLLDILAESPHAAELLDVNDSLADDVTRAATARFRGLLAGALAAADRAGEIHLGALGLGAERVAEILVAALPGMKQAGEAPAETQARVVDLVTLVAAALTDGPARQTVGIAASRRVETDTVSPKRKQ